MQSIVQNMWPLMVISGVLGCVIGVLTHELRRFRRLNATLLILCIDGYARHAQGRHAGVRPVGFTVEVTPQSRQEMMAD